MSASESDLAPGESPLPLFRAFLPWRSALTRSVLDIYHDFALTRVYSFQRLNHPSGRSFSLFSSLLLVIVLAAAAVAAQSPQQIKPTGYVLDYAGVLSPATRENLTDLCTQVDKLAQAQIAIVTVKSLEGRPIEDYSIDLATRLGVGPKASDRGVLILLAVDDHKYRIEVGYGLEGILPDGKVGGFGREALPLLRDQNYDAAVLLMARRVADTIAADRGVTLPPTPGLRSVLGAQPPRARLSTGSVIFWVILFLVFGYLFLLPIVRFLFGSTPSRGRPGRWMGGGFGGPFIGGGGWGGMMGGGFGGGAGGGGFGGFGGGSFGGGGASGSW